MQALALYTEPKPQFAGSINEWQLSLSLWRALQGILTVRSMDSTRATVTRMGLLSPSFVVRAQYVDIIERDEYNAEWLTALAR